ncbi:MAG: hypothetical protein ACI4RT_02400 [Candidatus Spyradenecus sp.]
MQRNKQDKSTVDSRQSTVRVPRRTKGWFARWISHGSDGLITSSASPIDGRLSMLFLALALAATAFAAPSPMQSADGTLYVGCQQSDRAPMRAPVLRFAETVKRHFEEDFLSLGSTTSPLSILLGSETNAVSTLVKDRFALRDQSFSQLIIRVPNPDTVDLELLRTAIIEALLRARARALAGSYTALTWPPWFLQGAVEASKGNLALAEACERVFALREAGALPTLEALFAPGAPAPDPAVATCFARWLLTLNAQAYTPREGESAAEITSAINTLRRDRTRSLEALLTTPWTAEAILPLDAATAWHAWLDERERAVLLPGAITRSQFARWHAALSCPSTPEAARALSERLSREAVGKPQPFCDLTELYLRACAAAALGDAFRAAALWSEADEAAAVLAAHLQREPILQQTPQAIDPKGSRFNE